MKIELGEIKKSLEFKETFYNKKKTILRLLQCLF